MKTIYDLSDLFIQKGESSYGYVAYYATEIKLGDNETVTIDNVVYYVESEDSYIAIGLSDWHYSNSVNLDSRTTRIYKKAFNDSRYLFDSIDLSNCKKLTSIGADAFSSCTSLTSIILPSSLTSIGRGAFSECSELTSLTFEEGGIWYTSNGDEYEIVAGVDYSSYFIEKGDVLYNSNFYKK